MDNFFASLGRHLRQNREAPVAVSPGKSEPPAKETGADWTERVASVAGRNSLLVPAWYRGVSLIMQTMGQMVVQYQRRNKTGGNYQEDLYGANGRLNYLLQVRPNALMTASQMLEQIEFRKLYRGNAYVYVERSWEGDVEALWLCSDATYNLLSDTYALTYYRPGGAVALADVPTGQVLHFRNVFLRGDTLQGQPAIDYALRALQISATADLQSLHDMAKGGKQKILVTASTPTGPNGRPRATCGPR